MQLSFPSRNLPDLASVLLTRLLVRTNIRRYSDSKSSRTTNESSAIMAGLSNIQGEHCFITVFFLDDQLDDQRHGLFLPFVTRINWSMRARVGRKGEHCSEVRGLWTSTRYGMYSTAAKLDDTESPNLTR
ncbi:hypothetical protein PM082_000168 [Marasmius tenuissimus]|nr:hypothetical protein PM082_000168 [Marasmius tenuissimus]